VNTFEAYLNLTITNIEEMKNSLSIIFAAEFPPFASTENSGICGRQKLAFEIILQMIAMFQREVRYGIREIKKWKINSG
jgi:hypothetical protein